MCIVHSWHSQCGWSRGGRDRVLRWSQRGRWDPVVWSLLTRERSRDWPHREKSAEHLSQNLGGLPTRWDKRAGCQAWGPSHPLSGLESAYRRLPDLPMHPILWLCLAPRASWWLRRLRICLHCRRPRLSPWAGELSWRRDWLPTLVFLSGEFHGQRSLAGDHPRGQKELDTTEELTASPVARLVKNPPAVQETWRATAAEHGPCAVLRTLVYCSSSLSWSDPAWWCHRCALCLTPHFRSPGEHSTLSSSF